MRRIWWDDDDQERVGKKKSNSDEKEQDEHKRYYDKFMNTMKRQTIVFKYNNLFDYYHWLWQMKSQAKVKRKKNRLRKIYFSCPCDARVLFRKYQKRKLIFFIHCAGTIYPSIRLATCVNGLWSTSKALTHWDWTMDEWQMRTFAI